MTKLLASIVSISAAAIIMTGCSTKPPAAVTPELSGTIWLVEDINGQGVLDMLQSTLHFKDAENVTGNGGCNNFFSIAYIDEWLISFGPIGTTRMACSEAIMDQEQRYLNALAATGRYQYNPETDLLYFYDGNNKNALRFSRTQP
jgi:heat shock protein HslJ